MDENEKKLIEENILKLIEELEGEITEHNENSEIVEPNNAVGRLSRMEAIQAKSVNDATFNNKRKRLIRLKEALSKINSPHFGECNVCGENINYKRMLASPEANVCSDCIKENSK